MHYRINLALAIRNELHNPASIFYDKEALAEVEADHKAQLLEEEQ